MITLPPAVNTYFKFTGIGWVYVMSDLSLRAPTGKVGVKGDADSGRMIDIQRSIRQETEYTEVDLYPVWAFPSFAPKEVEKRVHKIHRIFKTDKFAGSNGGTEWFAGGNWLAAFLMTMLCFHYDPPLAVAIPAIIFTWRFPIPIDLCITVTWVGTLQLLASSAFWAAIFSLLYYLHTL